MSVGTNKRHLVSSRPCHGCLHARTRTHWVTNACDLIPWKKVRRVLQGRQCWPMRDKFSWSVPIHLEVALLVSQITTRCCAGSFVSHLVLPCATVIVHARRVCHSRCPAIQLSQCLILLHFLCLPHLPLLLACPNQKLRGCLETSCQTGD